MYRTYSSPVYYQSPFQRIKIRCYYIGRGYASEVEIDKIPDKKEFKNTTLSFL